MEGRGSRAGGPGWEWGVAPEQTEGNHGAATETETNAESRAEVFAGAVKTAAGACAKRRKKICQPRYIAPDARTISPTLSLSRESSESRAVNLPEL